MIPFIYKKFNAVLKPRLVTWLLNLVKPYRYTACGLLLLILLTGILEPSRPYMVQLAIDRYVALRDKEGLFKIIVIMLGLLVLQMIAQYCLTYLSDWLGQHVVRDLRIKIYSHIIRLNATFHSKTPIGRLLAHTISDTGKLLDVLSQDLAPVLVDILQIVAMAIFMFYMNWKLATLSLSVIPLLLWSSYFFKNKIKKVYGLGNEAAVKMTTFVQNRLSAMRLVQVFNRQDIELATFKSINKAYHKANRQATVFFCFYFSSLEVMRALAISLLIWYGIPDVLEGLTTLGSLTAFLMYIKMFFRPITHLAEHFNTLQRGLVSTDKIIDLLEVHASVENRAVTKEKVIQGHLSFESVWFSYPGHAYILKNISFEIPIEKSLAIVGVTGAGKSTIINLLARFYDPQKGAIKIDGIHIMDYDLHTLRKYVGLVFQDAFLFSSSIYENITLGEQTISMERVVEAAKMIGAHTFIENLPDGYHYKVGERGLALSMGQRQLLAFVRAVVYDPRILILDEATASLDGATGALVQQAIKKILVNRTAIIIAHRLSTIQEVDNILVLDQGEIKEMGSHKALLAKNGHYAALYKSSYRFA